jgi:hypothetical protein
MVTFWPVGGFFFHKYWVESALDVSLNGSSQQIRLVSFCVLKTVEMLRKS